jgi:hypothetical protein
MTRVKMTRLELFGLRAGWLTVALMWIYWLGHIIVALSKRGGTP